MKFPLSAVGILVVLVGFLALTRKTPVPHSPQYDITVTPAEFAQTVGQKDVAVLVKFGAPWCPPCVQMEPELDQVAENLGSEVDILQINVDNNQELASFYQATTIPKMVLFRGGKAISNRVGFMNSDQVTRWIENTK